MRKNKISFIITIVLIGIIISLSAYILIKENAPSIHITEELAKCIGENSELYVQTGCPACERQEELFGENLKYLNSIDCFLKENRQTCIDKEIDATPTWIIGEKRYKGFQSIETLKKLTNC